ncbi:Protein ALTERED XYLOGLUCAN 4, partial [Mucuna pruriens]
MGSTNPFIHKFVSLTKGIVLSTLYALLSIALLFTYLSALFPLLNIPQPPPPTTLLLLLLHPSLLFLQKMIKLIRTRVVILMAIGFVTEEALHIMQLQVVRLRKVRNAFPMEGLTRVISTGDGKVSAIFQEQTCSICWDSLARNQLESLLCMLAIVSTPNLVYRSGKDNKFRCWHFPSHIANFSLYWSPFLVQGVEWSNEGAYYNTMYIESINEEIFQ